MALITCPDCGAQVSDRAKNCIHCGAPLIAEENVLKIKTPKNQEVVVNVVYDFYDDHTGKRLASATKNSLVTIKLDAPTRIRAHRSGLGWKDFYLDYTPRGLSKYQIVQKKSFMKEWMEFQEVEVFDSAD